MVKSPHPVPPGYRSITPYLIVDGGAKAIAFYKKAFGAVISLPPITRPDGRIGHAELRIGDSVIMLADEMPQMNIRAPQIPGEGSITIHLYVDDVDEVARRALAAGATEKRPVADQFYGDRTGSFVDPFGHVWHVATHIEDVPPDELQRRAEAAMKAKA